MTPADVAGLVERLRLSNPRLQDSWHAADALAALSARIGKDAERIAELEETCRIHIEYGKDARAKWCAKQCKERIVALEAELALRQPPAERDRLREFARVMFTLADWPSGGDIDCGDFQDAAVACGLLVEETRHETCSEGICWCEENNGPDDWKAGVRCYRKVAWLTEEKQT